jgi:hypothetical protein
MLPRKLHKYIFLIDGFGALTSCMFLGLVLPRLNTGVPNQVLLILSLVAWVFSVYSLTCFFKNKNQFAIFLKIILLCNLLYTLVTIAMLTYFYKQVTFFGFLYFIGEIIILSFVCWAEFKILKLKNSFI